MKSNIRKILRENMQFETCPFGLVETMMVEDYPTSFDMEHFKTLTKFKHRIDYCEQHLKRISSGSSRIVYMIDDTKVLKLAKNQKGLAQNETEIQWGQDSYFGPLLAHTFDHHPDDLWVEMELARKVNKTTFKNFTGCEIDALDKYLRNIQSENNGKRGILHIDAELIAEFEENQFVADLVDFMLNIDALAGDLGVLTSYGIVKRNGQDDIVLIDFGVTNSIYDTYYT